MSNPHKGSFEMNPLISNEVNLFTITLGVFSHSFFSIRMKYKAKEKENVEVFELSLQSYPSL